MESVFGITGWLEINALIVRVPSGGERPIFLVWFIGRDVDIATSSYLVPSLAVTRSSDRKSQKSSTFNDAGSPVSWSDNV